jgi:acyl-CoA hydrolase
MYKEIALEYLDFAEFINAGDTVVWGQACSEPLCLTERLVAQRDSIGPFTVLVGLSLSDTLSAECLQTITAVSYGALGTNARLMANGSLQVIPCNYSALPYLFTSKKLAVDVVLVQVSPPDSDGNFSLGLSNDYLIPAMQAARFVIAEVNEKIPHTTLDQTLDSDLFDIVVPCSRPPIYFENSAIGLTEKSIAGHVAGLIPDGSIIQYGVGTLPSAILSALSDHQRLGIYSGMITDDIIDLIESGVVTNETNPVTPEVSVGAIALGSERLNRYLHNNPQVQLHPTTKTHGPATLSKLDNLVAINSALEVDIYGQINAEMVSDRYLGAVGGQVDFMHAASTNKNGLSIIAMPSTTRHGKHSRIVAQLNGPLVTTGKTDVDVIVTEHGVADLRGKTMKQRAQTISNIAASHLQDSIKAPW